MSHLLLDLSEFDGVPCSQVCSLSRFYKAKKNPPCERKSVMRQAFMFPNLLHIDAIHNMIMHDAVKALNVKAVSRNAKCNVKNFTQLPFCQPVANVHTIPTLPSRLRNSIFKFFTHSFADDV